MEADTHTTDAPPASGRRAQAARNDTTIIEAAREVFIANPSAPIADVAKAAGVGISALYRRYPSKEDLLRELCADGLRRYISAAEAASADDGDPWESFAAFMQRVVAADAASLTQRLAGTFVPSEDLYRAAAYAGELNRKVFDRAQQAGVIRPDADVNDLGVIFEQLASIQLGDHDRTHRLRRRYLALALDGLRARPHDPLPGPAPSGEELTSRWRPRS
ncbi:MAG TPA: helix-turn-helix domain-containing protein [Thermoleophilaceae bacterium]|jgi:AcrR family transcriptional regulator|nr:helix-turn-helix domain-containing protein [Thermoleophilaceae bacterium]